MMGAPFIMVAPNGARRGKADHPALPITTPEIVATAQACFAAGADAMHLHIRDDQGNHSIDAGRYAEVLTELAAQVPDLAVQITTEAAGIFDVPAQFNCLRDLRPDWASISVREIARAPELAAKIYATCADQGTKVQHILYGLDDIDLLREWQGNGTVSADQTDVLFVLGRYTTGQVSSPADLDPFLDAMRDAKNWMICAFGAQEHECLAYAAKRGGALRVGFENSLTDAQNHPHLDNAASIKALRALLKKEL